MMYSACIYGIVNNNNIISCIYLFIHFAIFAVYRLLSYSTDDHCWWSCMGFSLPAAGSKVSRFSVTCSLKCDVIWLYEGMAK